MSKGKVLLVICCIITLALFGTMVYLMMGVDPPRLPLAEFGPTEKGFEENLPDRPQFEIIQITPYTSFLLRNSTTESYHSLLKYTVKRVVPPIWPVAPKAENPSEIQFKTVNKTEKVDANDTNTNNTHVKRSIEDFRKLGSELNSLVLKIIDDSGRINIEIKISSNDAFAVQEKESRTSENRTEVKDQSKYNITVKTNSNGNFSGSKLEENTITSISPNNSLTVDKNGNNLISENKLKHDVFQVSAQKNSSTNIVHVITTTEHCIKGNKSTVMVPNHKTNKIKTKQI